MALEPTDYWKVDQVKYGKLRDHHLQVYQEGQNLSVVHTPTGISVQADSRDSASENWEIAQQSLNSSLEHQEAVGMRQSPRKGDV